ncbi:MAG TPA: peptide-methionine (S)-S-oxide reductase MsrA [Gemmatimonadales bacterium]|nr:peptide-methionine (S)-S-oxide reductase MsrA [Gemmatimonadales bacterium]
MNTLLRGFGFVTLASLGLGSRVLAQSPADTAAFAGGCFWGIEGVFEHVKGVTSATPGYAGGSVQNPSYERVSSGTTGHAESVRVVYDPSQVSYEQLLQVFFAVALDPTELNRQGPDVGTQYRSIVFYRDSVQHRAASAFIADLTSRKVYGAPIVTEVDSLGAFYPAEGYHQHYMQRHPNAPYIVYNDAPKVKNLKRDFPALYWEAWHQD